MYLCIYVQYLCIYLYYICEFLLMVGPPPCPLVLSTKPYHLVVACNECTGGAVWDGVLYTLLMYTV